MHSEALKATDDYSAARSTAPRVSLADMESKIVQAHYFTAGDAVELLSQRITGDSPLYLLTLCILTMRNGFTVVGKSAPASPENFDAEKGKRFAYEDAIKQLWPLEGYALRERLAASQSTQTHVTTAGVNTVLGPAAWSVMSAFDRSGGAGPEIAGAIAVGDALLAAHFGALTPVGGRSEELIVFANGAIKEEGVAAPPMADPLVAVLATARAAIERWPAGGGLDVRRALCWNPETRVASLRCCPSHAVAEA